MTQFIATQTSSAWKDYSQTRVFSNIQGAISCIREWYEHDLRFIKDKPNAICIERDDMVISTSIRLKWKRDGRYEWYDYKVLPIVVPEIE